MCVHTMTTTTNLQRAIEQMPTTDLQRLAKSPGYGTPGYGTPGYSTTGYDSLKNRSTTSLMREIQGSPMAYNSMKYNNNNNRHSYTTTSLKNRSTSSLLREVDQPMVSSPVYTQTSMAISIGQCPKNHVYDAEGQGCLSVYSHKFANKALTYALSRANHK